MTRELSLVADNVLAYEIDEELKEEHDKRLGDRDNITILFQDFLGAFCFAPLSRYRILKRILFCLSLNR